MANGNVFSKVKILEGDLQLPGLGLSAQDQARVQAEVDIILHCAASIELDAPIQKTLRNNYIGTKQLMEVAASMPNLCSFVHVSTYCVNNNRPHNSTVQEAIYPLVLSLDGGITEVQHSEFVQGLMAMSADEAAAKAAQVMRINNNFGSTYAFGKHLTEQLVADTCIRPGLHKAIVRPALIAGLAGDPYPGYISSFAGPGGYTMVNPPPVRLPFSKYVKVTREHRADEARVTRGHRVAALKLKLLAAGMTLAGKGKLVPKLKAGLTAHCVANSLPYAASMVCCTENVRALKAMLSPAESHAWPILWHPAATGIAWEDYLSTFFAGVRQLLFRMTNPDDIARMKHPSRFVLYKAAKTEDLMAALMAAPVIKDHQSAASADCKGQQSDEQQQTNVGSRSSGSLADMELYGQASPSSSCADCCIRVASFDEGLEVAAVAADCASHKLNTVNVNDITEVLLAAAGIGQLPTQAPARVCCQ
eukprot:gene8751-8931_t